MKETGENVLNKVQENASAEPDEPRGQLHNGFQEVDFHLV
jgi:hypothetical protein